MLQNLPEELLDQIFSLFARPTPSRPHVATFHNEDLAATSRSNQKTLAAVSRVSRMMHRLAQPHLYHVCAHIDDHNLDSLLMTLAVTRSPSTALVKELQIQHKLYPSRVEGVQPDEIAMQAFHQAIERTMSDKSSVVRTKLASGEPHLTDQARTALLLALCSNLKVLVLETQLWQCSSWIARVVGALAYHEQHTLSELVLLRHDSRHFQGLDDSDDEDPDYDTAHEYACTLPSLRTFRGVGLVMVDTLDCFYFTSIHAPLLQKIILRDSMLDDQAILDILQRYPLLEHLQIHWGGNAAIDQFSAYYDLIGDHLREHGRRLRTLELDIGEPMYNEFHDFTSQPLMGSLAELEQLEHLRIQVALLVGEPPGGDAEYWEPDDVEDPPEQRRNIALEDVLSRSLQRLELLDWPETLPLNETLVKVMDPASFSPLRVIQVDFNGKRQVESAPTGWNVSRKDYGNLTYQRFDLTEAY